MASFAITSSNFLQDQIYTAGLDWRAEAVLAASLVLAGVGVFLGHHLRIRIFQDISSLALAMVFGAIPFLVVRHKRRKRLGQFEQHFPEALDFLGRSWC